MVQQLSGINFLIFFSTKIFNKLSGNGSTVTLVIAVSNILGGVIGSYTVGSFGRKVNMTMGSIVSAISFGALSIGKFKIIQN